MDGVAAHPRARGVCPLALESDDSAHGALASSFDDSAGGLAEDGNVGGQVFRNLREQFAEAVVLEGYLFARVEHVGNVDGWLGNVPGEFDHDRDAALHIGRSEAVELVLAFETGGAIAVLGDGVEVTTDCNTVLPVEICAGDDVVADADDFESGDTGEFSVQPVCECSLVEAFGGNVDQVGGELHERVSHASSLFAREAMASSDWTTATRIYSLPSSP